MAKCAYCNQRRGKRTCPVVGRICSLCCGQHRGEEIDCPENCTNLKPPGTSNLDSVLSRLFDFATTHDTAWARKAARAFLGPEARLEEWEQASFLGFLAWEYADEDGDRAIDRFLREHARTLSSSDRKELECLQVAWASLFEVREVHPGKGLFLEDSITGEELFVHEKLATESLEDGEFLLAWIIRRHGHNELSGAGAKVPPAHVDVVERAILASIAKTGGTVLEPPERGTVTKTITAAHHALRHAVQHWKPEAPRLADGSRVAVCKAIYEVKAADKVQSRLAAHRDITEVVPGRRFVWTSSVVSGPSSAAAYQGEVELRTVRLTLTTLSREQLKSGKHFLQGLLGKLVKHRLDRFEDPFAGIEDHTPATDPAVIGADPDPSPESIERTIGAFHREMERQIDSRAANTASLQIPEDDGRCARPHRRRRAPAKHDGHQHNLPPMAHETMYRHLPALKKTVNRMCRRLRSVHSEPFPTFSPAELAEMPETTGLVDGHALEMVQRGESRQAAVSEAEIVGSHLLYALNFEIHRRKTFWVDEGLAWMLAQTDMDISGSCLELPFPAFALVFSDRGTLELGESLLSQDSTRLSGHQPLALITIYVTRLPSTETDVQPLNLSLVFDSNTDRWPYLISRDLYIQAEDHLTSILDSHFPGITPEGLDPIFLLPELKKLIHIAINATLYATSAHLNPILLEPVLDRSFRGKKRRRAARRAGRGFCSEKVFHLPGKIRVSQIKSIMKLRSYETGRKLLKRFMVRGHWRRANPTWKDQRLRWIEPFWKGPDLATIIEKEYRLEP